MSDSEAARATYEQVKSRRDQVVEGLKECLIARTPDWMKHVALHVMEENGNMVVSERLAPKVKETTEVAIARSLEALKGLELAWDPGKRDSGPQTSECTFRINERTRGLVVLTGDVGQSADRGFASDG
jgi:hypothetical protein